MKKNTKNDKSKSCNKISDNRDEHDFKTNSIVVWTQTAYIHPQIIITPIICIDYFSLNFLLFFFLLFWGRSIFFDNRKKGQNKIRKICFFSHV